MANFFTLSGHCEGHHHIVTAGQDGIAQLLAQWPGLCMEQCHHDHLCKPAKSQASQRKTPAGGESHCLGSHRLVTMQTQIAALHPKHGHGPAGLQVCVAPGRVPQLLHQRFVGRTIQSSYPACALCAGVLIENLRTAAMNLQGCLLGRLKVADQADLLPTKSCTAARGKCMYWASMLDMTTSPALAYAVVPIQPSCCNS